MRLPKILGTIVGAVAAVIVVLLVSVRLFVDPDHYKPALVEAVKAATGRDLVLQGDIHLAVFPWIAFEVGPASLGNPSGFGAVTGVANSPFLSFRHASLRARLLPLLSKRLEIGRIDIDGLELHLVKDVDGRGNWEGFGTSGAQAGGAYPLPGPVSGAAAGESGRHVFAGLAGVTLRDARVSYGPYTLENLNVDMGAFAPQALVPVTVRFNANRGIAGEAASAELNLDLSGDIDAGTYQVAALRFHGTLSRAGNPRPVRWNFTASALDLDVRKQTLSAPAFALDVAGALVSGSLTGRDLWGTREFAGTMSLAPLVVREYLPRLGLTALRTRDPRALSLASASCAFSYVGRRAALDDLEVTVDSTHLKGKAALGDVGTRTLQFTLAVDGIDLDRYLPPPGAPDPPPPTPSVPAAAAASAAPKAPPLDVNGSLTVGAVHLAPLDLTAVNVTLAATGGVVHLFPLQAQVDGGQYSGNIVFDRRDPVPLLTLDERLIGIDVGRLAGAAAQRVHLAGRADLTLRASAHGAESDAILNSLNGRLDAVVHDGALEGVDIGYQLARADALLERQNAPAATDTRRTPFVALSMSADIANGVARTHDLTIASPVFKVTGQGSFDLPTQVLDLALLAQSSGTAGNAPLQIPITVTGTAADPSVRPDLDALIKGELGRRVKDVLKDKLKGLFNR